MQEIILKVRYFERGLSKSLKKITSFVLSNPVPSNRQNYQKQKGPGTSDQWLFRLQNKFSKISLLVMHYLFLFLFLSVSYRILHGHLNLTKFDDVI